MPDQTAVAVAFFVVLGNGFHDFFDGEILLIAADFLNILIEQDEVADQLHHTLFAEQGNHRFVLNGRRAIRDQLGCLLIHEYIVFFLPHIPELTGRFGGGVFDGIPVGGHDDLGVLKKLGNIIHLLVSYHLIHGLLYGNVRSFALNDTEGNAVDKQHDIRASRVLLVQAVHREFLGDMEHVVFRVLPIDVFQVKTKRFALSDSFRIAFSQQKGVIDLLAGTHQTIGQGLVQILHGPLNIGGGEFIFRTGVGIAVQPAKLPPEDVL